MWSWPRIWKSNRIPTSRIRILTSGTDTLKLKSSVGSEYVTRGTSSPMSSLKIVIGSWMIGSENPPRWLLSVMPSCVEVSRSIWSSEPRASVTAPGPWSAWAIRLWLRWAMDGADTSLLS